MTTKRERCKYNHNKIHTAAITTRCLDSANTGDERGKPAFDFYYFYDEGTIKEYRKTRIITAECTRRNKKKNP